MADRLERWGRSVLQHGPANDRIYLMKLAAEDCPGILDDLERLAGARDYGKIFAKVPQPLTEPFLQRGYRLEARIPGMFKGEADGVFLGKFFKPEREREARPEVLADILKTARGRQGTGRQPMAEGEQAFRLRPLQSDEVAEAAELYGKVFDSYPFPIHDADYLRETMATHVRYVGVWQGGKLVALASAELFADGGHAEMTDFATLPESRGQGLAGTLLARMEDMVRREGIRTAYTIARSYSFGMNITFAREGYEYGGTLRNNTQICGRLESMNVWYKPL